MNQNFSSDQLIKLCKEVEITNSGRTKEQLSEEIDAIFSEITAGTFDFELSKSAEFYLTPSLTDKLILRKLNDNLRRLYKDVQSNRRMIVTQVSTLLAENCPFWVLKTDISKFYESINRDRIVEKLQSDSMLSYFSIQLIKKLFSHPLLENKSGLPRGISISSTMSELFMRKFDRWATSYPGVYFYARFVDDIIIFSYDRSLLEKMESQIDENLEIGLKKNQQKTQLFDGRQIIEPKPLNFLGYKFLTVGDKQKKKVDISIAEKKLKKIKSRIVYAFNDFNNTGNFAILEKRIRFLTGNYSIKNRSDGHDLRAGIYYNYVNIKNSNHPVFDELNNFLQRTLHSKRHSFGIKLNAKLNSEQRTIIGKYSFKNGFKNKVYHRFTYSELQTITRCWK
ncbi:antiviral reverse transcriptase Drt3a [Dyadobacter sp. 32]|uniref:antiviral reverse transcriptase Drt3a n=1 Tax=Dyadobacter sp. 32 TaxID=538966 RepID=UPI0039C671C8